MLTYFLFGDRYLKNLFCQCECSCVPNLKISNFHLKNQKFETFRAFFRDFNEVLYKWFHVELFNGIHKKIMLFILYCAIFDIILLQRSGIIRVSLHKLLEGHRSLVGYNLHTFRPSFLIFYAFLESIFFSNLENGLFQTHPLNWEKSI